MYWGMREGKSWHNYQHYNNDQAKCLLINNVERNIFNTLRALVKACLSQSRGTRMKRKDFDRGFWGNKQVKQQQQQQNQFITLLILSYKQIKKFQKWYSH